MVKRRSDLKEKSVDFPVEGVMVRRWSPCVWADDEVGMELIQRLFEAARWAPSSYNEQPWSFVIGVKGTPEWEAILGCLVDANQEWAKSAPVLGISVTRLQFAKNGKPNRHAFHDVGLAMGALVLEATAMGLQVHQMSGFRVEQAREDLGVPEGHDPVAAFAIGYPGEVQGAPEKLRGRDEAEATRKGQKEWLFTGKWGNVFYN